MSTAEYFVPSVASRAKAVAAFAAILLWGFTHHLWFTPLLKQIDACAVCSTLWATRLVALYMALLPMPLCLWFAYTADQILRSGQNPPPKSWLLFKVRLYRGLRAKIGAYSLAVAAFAIALAPGFLAYQFGFSYLFCIAEDCGCSEEHGPSEQACGRSAERTAALYLSDDRRRSISVQGAPLMSNTMHRNL
jgi:hypothetical protein